MKKVLLSLAITAAVITGGAVTVNPAKVSAATKCDAHGVGQKTMTNYTQGNTAYKVANGKATITFQVVGNNCHLPVTMIAWKAPNGTTGKPYAQQQMFAHTTDTFSEGLHQMTIPLPDCFYQVDTVTGTKLTGSTGQAFNYDTRQVGFIHGGTKSCVKPTPVPTPATPTPTPVPPAVPEAAGGAPSAEVEAAPAALVNTGPVSSAVIGGVVASSIAGYLFAQHRARRQYK